MMANLVFRLIGYSNNGSLVEHLFDLSPEQTLSVGHPHPPLMHLPLSLRGRRSGLFSFQTAGRVLFLHRRHYESANGHVGFFKDIKTFF